jgi:thiamine-phosphate pyrophosphorylase
MAELDTLQKWSLVTEIPCVAIGGITPDNAKPLIDAGADFLAVSSAVWNHSDGAAAAVQAFGALFAQ